jgi:nucleoside-diphosphate-sugar epimerase
VQREVLDPAVKGTLNVLKVCSTLKVHKVVVMSSNAAVTSNPNWPQDRLKDESCWSDTEFCKEKEVRNSSALILQPATAINKYHNARCTADRLVGEDVCLFHLLVSLFSVINFKGKL